MIAHGYGLAANASPQLVFSNVLWGYMVRAIPTINGVLGYSLATLAVLLAVGWAMLYFMLRLGAGYLIGFLAAALLIARPTLFPQFTVNAGLLTAAAVIGWQVYARCGSSGSLVAACLLAFLGYLIRDNEFFLVLGVALPFLPWRALRELRQAQIAFFFLAVAIVFAAAFDHWSYSGPEWQSFMELDAPRTAFTDFGAAKHLKQRPEILARHHYSENDIDLVRAWFYADPQIANPKSLNAMLAELGPLHMQEGGARSGFSAIESLSAPILLPLLLPALLLLLLMPRWSVALAWALFLAALFAIGVAGRPGILRVYVPLVSLLFVMGLVVAQARDASTPESTSGTSTRRWFWGTRRWLLALAILAACAGNAYLLIPEALLSRQASRQVQRDIKAFPAEPVVSWGGEFLYELTFPLLSADPGPRNIRLYALDALMLAPFSVATAEEMAGHGMIERLRSAGGVPIIAPQNKMNMLRIYCKEHLHGQLRETASYPTQSFPIRQMRCNVDE